MLPNDGGEWVDCERVILEDIQYEFWGLSYNGVYYSNVEMIDGNR